MLVDEIHNLNLATSAGEDMSDHLKYFTEHLPATFVYAGINVERSGLFTGVRGKQIAGRCVLAATGPFPCQQEWTGLVATMEAALRLHRHQPGTLPGLGRYLHQRTGGMIGSLSHLIRLAPSPPSWTAPRKSPARRLTASRSITPRNPAHVARPELWNGRSCCGRCRAWSRPFRDETITSYLHRLAGPNHVDPAALRALLSGSDRKDAQVPLSAACRRHRDALPAAGLCHAADLHRRGTVRPAPAPPATRPAGMGVPRLPALRRLRSRSPSGRCTTTFVAATSSLDQQRPRAARPHPAAGDPARIPAAPAADPPPRPGPGYARAPRRTAHLHRLAPERAARPRLRPPHGDLLRPRLGRHPGEWAPQAFDAATYPQSVALARLLASPYWRERILGARVAACEFTAELRRAVAPDYTWENYLRTRAAIGTTRCSNGDWIPAASSSSRSRPAMPGTCPKPSSPLAPWITDRRYCHRR